MKCVTCSTEMVFWTTMPIDPKKKTTNKFSKFERCPQFNYGSVNPLPSPDEVPAFYDLDKYYTQGENHMPNVKSNIIDKILLKVAYWADKGNIIDYKYFLNELPPKSSVLEVGSGSGETLKLFDQHEFNVSGVEPDINSTSHTNSYQFPIYQGTAEKIPKEVYSKSYDLIIMKHVLEHCIDPRLALQNIKEISNENTLFWVEVPNCDCEYFNTMNVFSEMFDAPRHLHFFGEKSLEQLLRNSGFKVKERYFNGYFRHHSKPWRSWECNIYDQLKKYGSKQNVKRHTFMLSAILLLKTMFSKPSRKYDTVGFICRLDN